MASMEAWKNTSSERYDTISELKNRIRSHLLCGIYTMKYYLAIEKKEIMPFAATWREPEITILSKVSPTEKDKYYMISLISGI